MWQKNPAFLKSGSFVHFSDCDCELLKISKSRDKILLKLPSGEEKIFNIFSVMDQLQYIDQIDFVTRQMAKSSEGFCENIYNDLVSSVIETDIYNYANALKIDYTGYGYAQYANIVLSKSVWLKKC